MTRHSSSPIPPAAYRELVEHIQAIVDDHGEPATAKAIDDALASARRERFRQLYDVDHV